MHRRSRLLAALGCVATLAMVGCAANSAVTPLAGTTQQAQTRIPAGPDWHFENGVLYHTPHYMATRSAAQRQVSRAILLNYSGGPVLVTPKVYIVFWGYKTYGDPDTLKAPAAYSKPWAAAATTTSTPSTTKVGSTTTYITNPKKQLGGVWYDDTNAVPAHPTDAQVAAESLQLVAKVGYDANASYVVATPTGHSSTGFGTQWCAYHSATMSNDQLVSYTNLPYMPDAGT